jgi:DNA-binding MarR family transcriptional regulator
VWLRLLAATNVGVERLRRGLREQFEVTLPAFDLLAQVDRAPAGPTMSELSRRLMVTKGNVTDLVLRVEEKGLVERRPDERDGRVQHVHLTRAGEALLARMLPAHRAWLGELMAGVDAARLAQLHDLLGELKTQFLRLAERDR